MLALRSSFSWDEIAQALIARLRQSPDDPEAFEALRRHYERVGDFASLVNLLEGWAARLPDAATGAQAMYEAGELVLGTLGDRERSIGSGLVKLRCILVGVKCNVAPSPRICVPCVKRLARHLVNDHRHLCSCISSIHSCTSLRICL